MDKKTINPANRERIAINTKKPSPSRHPPAAIHKFVNRKNLFILVVVFLAGMLYFNVLAPGMAYFRAERMLAGKDYEGTLEGFAKLGNYRDSKNRMLEVHYTAGVTALNAGDIGEATDRFIRAGSYQDAPTRMQDYYYEQAEAALLRGDYESAVRGFTALGNYKDAPVKILEVYYVKGRAAFDAGDYKVAVSEFTQLGDYKDAQIKILEAYYLNSRRFIVYRDFSFAITVSKLGT